MTFTNYYNFLFKQIICRMQECALTLFKPIIFINIAYFIHFFNAKIATNNFHNEKKNDAISKFKKPFQV